ncbi:MAG: hypothetical protein IJH76_00230 [Clostridia bacterium]|nr:hypothetical protein [Clostridia bacterium]
MLVKEVKRSGKIGRNLLKDKSPEEIIELIIEKPLQKACKTCVKKNIETVMSSANCKNVLKPNEQRIDRKDVVEKAKTKLFQNFNVAGKGYAWIMINYNTLSDENKKKLFELEEKYGEDCIWFVKSSYNEFKNAIRKFFRLNPLVETFDDTYADKFKQKQLLIVYNNRYPRRSVFIRMPINETTTIDNVETYFDEILSNLKVQ